MNPVLSTYSVHTYFSSTYSERTWGKKYVQVCTLHKKYELKRSGTSRYNTIAWYEVVRTGLYRVRTTVHDSRCQRLAGLGNEIRVYLPAADPGDRLTRPGTVGRGPPTVGPYCNPVLQVAAACDSSSSAKWAVHIYYQYAKYEPCTILHIDFGVCISSCILLHIYAKQYAQYAK